MTDSPTPDQLIAALKVAVGLSGTIAVLDLLRQFNPYQLEPENPAPMFFDDAWEEHLSELLTIALKDFASSPGVQTMKIDDNTIVVVHPDMPPHIFDKRTGAMIRLEFKT